jgi:hypothetical protein
LNKIGHLTLLFKMNDIHIEMLYDKLKGILSDNFIGTMVECCVLRLTTQGHISPVELTPFNDSRNLLLKPLKLNWTTEITTKLAASYREENRITDYATMCIALILASKLTDFEYVEVSRQGDGVDFWFTEKDKTGVSARLEVSGIREASKANSVKNRLTIKLTQTNQSDKSGVPAYVSIIEFSQPEALYILK